MEFAADLNSFDDWPNIQSALPIGAVRSSIDSVVSRGVNRRASMGHTPYHRGRIPDHRAFACVYDANGPSSIGGLRVGSERQARRSASKNIFKTDCLISLAAANSQMYSTAL